jgi:integrase
MARAARDTKLETRTARLKLKPGRHFVLIVNGLSLMYRRPIKGSGTWSARIAGADGRESYHKLGEADDNQDAHGDTVLTFTQAQERARKLSKEAKATTSGKPVTVKEATAIYLEWFKNNRKSIRETEATIEAHILPIWGDKLLIDIKATGIKAWREKLAAQPARKRTSTHATKQAHRDKPVTVDEKRARKATANRILAVFKAILNHAFKEAELVSDDREWRKVKPFEKADSAVTRFLKDAEATRLINACRDDLRQMVKAALFTGCRYGELARLQVKDVNTDTGLIYITSEAKSGKGRHVPLSDEGRDFMQTAITGKVGTAFVFTRADGEPWGKNHHVRLLADACEQAKIEPAISFHDLRHSYASALAQRGVSLLTISNLLGHADTRITSRHYAHLCNKTLSDAVREFLPSFGHQSDSKVTDIGSRTPAKAA